MSVSEVVIPVVASLASALTSGGAFVAWLNRKTKRDRELDQEQHDTEIDRLKIDVTKDVVVLLREELQRKDIAMVSKDDDIDYLERMNGWLRRRIVRLENWADTVRRENPTITIPALPQGENEPVPTRPRRLPRKDDRNG